MRWIERIIQDLKTASEATPLRCPRGWGDVPFQVSLSLEPYPPFVDFPRRCPIGGVETCVSCRHPFNPQRVDLLREELAQLRSLLDDGLMSGEEYDLRRKMTISFQLFGTRMPGRASSTAAFILAPIGTAIAVTGLICAVSIHPGFWGVVVGGSLILGLGGSFAGISHRRRRDMTKLLDADEGPPQPSEADPRLPLDM